MVYRKTSYQEAPDYVPFKQEFTPFVKDYRLDEHNNVLVETGTHTNIQEKIQSALESTFDKVLQKYLPDEPVDDTQDIKVLARMQDNLQLYAEALDVAEQYRDKFKLSDDLDAKQIYKYVADLSEEYKQKINAAQQKKLEDSNAALLAENAKLKKQLEGKL